MSVCGLVTEVSGGDLYSYIKSSCFKIASDHVFKGDDTVLSAGFTGITVQSQHITTGRCLCQAEDPLQ